jgi:predicted nucleotidyltransferase/HEPN domain-containing protein
MKSSLDHLPEQKRAQLRRITALLCETVPVDLVILFGSFARGDWVEDPINGYFSDFDILIVVEKPAVANNVILWSELTEKTRAITGPASVSFMPHDIREFNTEIRQGQYFFSDIVSEGIVLYDSKRFTLAKPKTATPAERLKLAEWNFKYWFTSAGGFWQGAGYYMNAGMQAHAAFLLHQSVERYFHAVLLVFTGYKPKSHNIEQLAKETGPMHEVLVDAMPRTAPEDSERFDLLKRAYIEARYSKSYRITDAQLTVLREQILDLAVRVRHACKDFLETIVSPEAVSELPEVPQPLDLEGLPEPPLTDDPEAMDKWRNLIVELCEVRGRQEGLREGEARGEARGRQEGLREGEARGRQEGLREGEARGRQEGMREERQRLITQLLETKFGALPADVLSKLQHGSQEELDEWGKRLLTAASLDEVFQS